MQIKKSFLLALLALCTILICNAQTSFNCSHITMSTWNKASKTFDNGETYAVNSRWTINKSETMITFTVLPNIESFTYSVNSKAVENDLIVYDITDSNGLKYLLAFDINNSEIRLVQWEVGGNISLVAFTVKSIF